MSVAIKHPRRMRQTRALHAVHRPGVPYNGPNLVTQRAESAKKSARRAKTAK